MRWVTPSNRQVCRSRPMRGEAFTKSPMAIKIRLRLKACHKICSSRFAALQAGGKREHHRNANQKQKRREDEVGARPTIPVGVLDWPVGQVVAARVVDQNHACDGESAKYIEAKQASGAVWRTRSSRRCPALRVSGDGDMPRTNISALEGRLVTPEMRRYFAC